MFPYGGGFNENAGLSGFNAFADAYNPDHQSMRYDIPGLDSMEEEYGGLGTFDRFGRRHSRNSSPRLHNSRYGFEFYGSHRDGYGDRDPSKGRIEFDDFAESDMFEDRYHRWGDGRDYDSMRRRRNANSHGYDSFGDYGGLWDDKAELDFEPFDNAFGGFGSTCQRNRRSRLLDRAQPHDHHDFADCFQELNLGSDYRGQSDTSRSSRRRGDQMDYFEGAEAEYVDPRSRIGHRSNSDLPSRPSLQPARYYGDDKIFEDYRCGGMHYEDLADFFGPNYMNDHLSGIDGRVGGGPFGGF